MKVIFQAFFLIVIFSCKRAEKAQNPMQSNLDSIPKEEQSFVPIDTLYEAKILSIIKKFRKNREVNGGESFKTDSAKIFIEVLEDLDENLDYTIRETDYSIRYNRNDTSYGLSFYVTSKDSILMVIENKTDDDRNPNKIEIKDTLYFKSNSIYFSKNNEFTKSELLKKEKELFRIKSKIENSIE